MVMHMKGTGAHSRCFIRTNLPSFFHPGSLVCSTEIVDILEVLMCD